MRKIINFLNLSYAEVVKFIETLGDKEFRATQIFKWIYQKGVTSFDQMKNLPDSLRNQLSVHFVLKPLNVSKEQISKDGTEKFLFELSDYEKIETVLIPTKTRNTVCVSTQVGCKFSCKFCASAIGGFKRNLTVSEIVGQIFSVKKMVGANNDLPLREISHIVFMGVGEPLDNYDNLIKSIRIINDKKGMNIGARRITISTCGLIPQIQKLSKEGLQVELAISLHASNDALRNKLVPINKKYPLKELMDACGKYYKDTNRQITFEYIMIKGLTCSEQAVLELKGLLKGFDSKLNLISFNEVPEFEYKTPSREDILAFSKKLTSAGIHSVIRTPRGKDISAACGQLRIQK